MADTPTMPHRILFVCLGNICRSPAAETIFRKLAADSGRAADFEIDSAGTAGFHAGCSPDTRMAATLKEKGYSPGGVARQLQSVDLEKFDLILTMDEENLAAVLKMDTRRLHHSKVHPFVDFCAEKIDSRVPDPYYGGQRGFNHVLRLLEDGCRGILAHFPAPVAVAG